MLIIIYQPSMMRVYLLGPLIYYLLDYCMKLILIGISVAYFISTIMSFAILAFDAIEIKMLKSKNAGFLKMYETFSQSHSMRVLMVPSSFLLLVAVCVMVVYGLDFWTILNTTILLGILFYAVVYYVMFQEWQEKN